MTTYIIYSHITELSAFEERSDQVCEGADPRTNLLISCQNMKLVPLVSLVVDENFECPIWPADIVKVHPNHMHELFMRGLLDASGNRLGIRDACDAELEGRRGFRSCGPEPGGTEGRGDVCPFTEGLCERRERIFA